MYLIRFPLVLQISDSKVSFFSFSYFSVVIYTIIYNSNLRSIFRMATSVEKSALLSKPRVNRKMVATALSGSPIVGKSVSSVPGSPKTRNLAAAAVPVGKRSPVIGTKAGAAIKPTIARANLTPTAKAAKSAVSASLSKTTARVNASGDNSRAKTTVSAKCAPDSTSTRKEELAAKSCGKISGPVFKPALATNSFSGASKKPLVRTVKTTREPIVAETKSVRVAKPFAAAKIVASAAASVTKAANSVNSKTSSNKLKCQPQSKFVAKSLRANNVAKAAAAPNKEVSPALNSAAKIVRSIGRIGERLKDDSEAIVEIRDADSTTTVEEESRDYDEYARVVSPTESIAVAAAAAAIAVSEDADSFTERGGVDENENLVRESREFDEERVYAVAEQLIGVMRPEQLKVITEDDNNTRHQRCRRRMDDEDDGNDSYVAVGTVSAIGNIESGTDADSSRVGPSKIGEATTPIFDDERTDERDETHRTEIVTASIENETIFVEITPADDGVSNEDENEDNAVEASGSARHAKTGEHFDGPPRISSQTLFVVPESNSERTRLVWDGSRRGSSSELLQPSLYGNSSSNVVTVGRVIESRENTELPPPTTSNIVSVREVVTDGANQYEVSETKDAEFEITVAADRFVDAEWVDLSFLARARSVDECNLNVEHSVGSVEEDENSNNADECPRVQLASSPSIVDVSGSTSPAEYKFRSSEIADANEESLIYRGGGDKSLSDVTAIEEMSSVGVNRRSNHVFRPAIAESFKLSSVDKNTSYADVLQCWKSSSIDDRDDDLTILGANGPLIDDDDDDERNERTFSTDVGHQRYLDKTFPLSTTTELPVNHGPDITIGVTAPETRVTSFHAVRDRDYTEFANADTIPSDEHYHNKEKHERQREDEHEHEHEHEHEADQHDETFRKMSRRHKKRNKRRNKKNRKSSNAENLLVVDELRAPNKNTRRNQKFDSPKRGGGGSRKCDRNSRAYYEAAEAFQQLQPTTTQQRAYYADSHWKYTVSVD